MGESNETKFANLLDSFKKSIDTIGVENTTKLLSQTDSFKYAKDIEIINKIIDVVCLHFNLPKENVLKKGATHGKLVNLIALKLICYFSIKTEMQLPIVKRCRVFYRQPRIIHRHHREIDSKKKTDKYIGDNIFQINSKLKTELKNLKK